MFQLEIMLKCMFTPSYIYFGNVCLTLAVTTWKGYFFSFPISQLEKREEDIEWFINI